MQIVYRLSDTGAPGELLQQLEVELRQKLPDDYRQFLSETNGGRPAAARFAMQKSTGANNSVVDWFLTLEPTEDIYTISQYRSMYWVEFRKDFCLSLAIPLEILSFWISARSVGNVYFWDHELEGTEDEPESDELESMDDEPTWVNISVIGPSFTEFLKLLE